MLVAASLARVYAIASSSCLGSPQSPTSQRETEANVEQITILIRLDGCDGVRSHTFRGRYTCSGSSLCQEGQSMPCFGCCAIFYFIFVSSFVSFRFHLSRSLSKFASVVMCHVGSQKAVFARSPLSQRTHASWAVNICSWLMGVSSLTPLLLLPFSNKEVEVLHVVENVTRQAHSETSGTL